MPEKRWRKRAAGPSTGGWSSCPASDTTRARCSPRNRRPTRWHRDLLRLPVAIGRAEDVALRRQHHVVEILREHRRGEERNRPQGLVASVGEVVPHRGRKNEHAAGPDRIVAVLGAQLALARDDVLRFLGG